MKNTKKMRVAVLYGGRSSEHEVSVSSAANIITHLDRNLFDVLAIKIDKQGVWFLEPHAAALASIEANPESSASQKLFAPVWLNEPEAIQKSQLAEIRHLLKAERLFDVIFPIMHGTFSEDGTIQGLLELADVPYVGSGVLASSVGMDKDVARRLVNYAGLLSVPYQVIALADWNLNAAAIEAELLQKFTFPMFAKPANQGSSIGVSKVKSPANLCQAIKHAFHYDTKILVEQGIDATELEVAILESLEPGKESFTSDVGEVRPHDEFYSYRAKYVAGASDFIIPAEIPENIARQAQQLSKKIFNILNIEGMARVDFFMDKKSQVLYFNEINTIPGFTPTSMYPMMMTASGMSYSDLLTQLVMLAVRRYQQKQVLERNYVV